MSRIVDKPYFTYSAYNALTSGIQVKCPKCHGTGMVTADDDNAYFRCLSCGHQETRDRTIYRYDVHNQCKNCGRYYRVDIEDTAKQHFSVLYVQRQYRMIAVRAGTILIDERLCDPSKLGRLRFTCAHELAHWVLHKKLYSGTGDVAAYNGNVSSDESHGIIERQADTLASALLMPLPQIKKCFYRLRIGRTDEQLVAEMANIFEVSKQAMQIRLKSRNLI